MIDGSEIRKRELAFELQSSRVFEKCSKSSHIKFCKQNKLEYCKADRTT